jgi:hypothetical protein
VEILFSLASPLYLRGRARGRTSKDKWGSTVCALRVMHGGGQQPAALHCSSRTDLARQRGRQAACAVVDRRRGRGSPSRQRAARPSALRYTTAGLPASGRWRWTGGRPHRTPARGGPSLCGAVAAVPSPGVKNNSVCTARLTGIMA